MNEEYMCLNNHDDVVPFQYQSHSTTDTVSYLIASSLNPHSMKYVTVDTELCQHTIEKNESKLCCHHSSPKNVILREGKIHYDCCQETLSVSPHHDKGSIGGSHSSLACRRYCPSDDTDLSAFTSDTQEMMWPDLSKTKSSDMIGQSISEPILCRENVVSNADTVPELSTNISQMSQKDYMQKIERSDSCSGQAQQQVDNIFVKTCRCRVCQQCFKDVFSLNFHIYKEHEKTARPTCVRCSATLVSLYSLFQHLMRHKRLLVKERAKRDKQLLESWPSRRNELNISCFNPNRIDSTIRNLNGELQNQDPETRSIFPCGACGKEYRHKKTLIAHMKVKHLGVQKKTYKCGFCLRPFSSLWQRNNHLSWRHFGRKPYMCQFCHQGFICLPTLRRHQRKIHTGEKPYRCLHCGESFFEKTSLDLHKAQMHTGIFPFVCSQCGRGFVQHSYLKNHWKTHSGLRPHKCLVCGKKYSKISHLKRHKISCCKKSGGKTLTKATHIRMK